jgi:hypothetical protein
MEVMNESDIYLPGLGLGRRSDGALEWADPAD